MKYKTTLIKENAYQEACRIIRVRFSFIYWLTYDCLITGASQPTFCFCRIVKCGETPTMTRYNPFPSTTEAGKSSSDTPGGVVRHTGDYEMRLFELCSEAEEERQERCLH